MVLLLVSLLKTLLDLLMHPNQSEINISGECNQNVNFSQNYISDKHIQILTWSLFMYISFTWVYIKLSIQCWNNLALNSEVYHISTIKKLVIGTLLVVPWIWCPSFQVCKSLTNVSPTRFAPSLSVGVRIFLISLSWVYTVCCALLHSLCPHYFSSIKCFCTSGSCIV